MSTLPLVIASGPLVVEAQAPLPTRHGTFEVLVFRYRGEPEREHVALVAGTMRDAVDLPVRVHSECLTSEAFGSLRCDCREQLEFSLSYAARHRPGLVLYLRQEGRDIGLSNKIRAYALQAGGMDTVEANRALGLPDDARRYESAAAMLQHLGVRSVRLMTNNPDKQSALRALGVSITGRIPVVVPANPHSLAYLQAKRTRMHHVLPGLAVNGDAE